MHKPSPVNPFLCREIQPPHLKYHPISGVVTLAGLVTMATLPVLKWMRRISWKTLALGEGIGAVMVVQIGPVTTYGPPIYFLKLEACEISKQMHNYMGWREVKTKLLKHDEQLNDYLSGDIATTDSYPDQKGWTWCLAAHELACKAWKTGGLTNEPTRNDKYMQRFRLAQCMEAFALGLVIKGGPSNTGPFATLTVDEMVEKMNGYIYNREQDQPLLHFSEVSTQIWGNDVTGST